MDRAQPSDDAAQLQQFADKILALQLQYQFDKELEDEQQRGRRELRPHLPRDAPASRRPAGDPMPHHSEGQDKGAHEMKGLKKMKIDEVLDNVEDSSRPKTPHPPPPPSLPAAPRSSKRSLDGTPIPTSSTSLPGPSTPNPPYLIPSLHNTTIIGRLYLHHHNFPEPVPSPYDDYTRTRIIAGPLAKCDIATLNRTLNILAFFTATSPDSQKLVNDTIDACGLQLQMGDGWLVTFHRHTTTGALTAFVDLDHEYHNNPAVIQRKKDEEKEELALERWKDRVLTDRRMLENRKEARLRAEGRGMEWDFGRGCPRFFDGGAYLDYSEWVLEEARRMERGPKMGIAELVEEKERRRKRGEERERERERQKEKDKGEEKETETGEEKKKG
ncbi:hypothetical protein K491DRAFT_774941 [Lophiostoma macrostomum CBS 122681]|uniref:Uncharacterized protein n=1 Tax=Lophiostoma macrostomum CBS 122681 TaxID=1314788 RepID=A0A6A6TLW7_9PLEO|nr:hypothetical protein K491DRAFT_774941 [Lophiostoma macrostomum CBS 122681]